MAQQPGRKSSPKPTSTDGEGSLTLVRVLVVEDHDAFRQFVVSMLGQRPDLQILCEASDGLEAVKIAAELQPDLVVLDIGLPGLHGIEAARRIRKLSPDSKILFVSQESSTDVVQEALTAGGLGYVSKAYAQQELLVAVEAALQSKQFVSSALTNGSRPIQRL